MIVAPNIYLFTQFPVGKPSILTVGKLYIPPLHVWLEVTLILIIVAWFIKLASGYLITVPQT
jgi:hypothetical protein